MGDSATSSRPGDTAISPFSSDHFLGSTITVFERDEIALLPLCQEITQQSLTK